MDMKFSSAKVVSGLLPLMVLSIGLMFGTSNCWANTVTFTDAASFNASSNTSLINFSGIAPTGDAFNVSSGLTINGVNFTSPPGNMFVVDPGYICCTIPGPPATLFDNDIGAGAAFSISLGTPVTAAGFLVANGDVHFPNGGTITVTLSDGFTTTFGGGTGNTPVFFGFTSDTAITGLTVSSQDNPSGINFTELANFQSGNAVPEPGSLLLFGSGVLGLAGAARRKFFA